MAQGGAGFNILSNRVSFADTASLDAFSRLRVSNPTYLFDAQLTYDLQPLLFEQVIQQTGGVSITHDANDRKAVLTFSNTPNGGKAYLQSYDWTRYQPGRGQLFLITFNFIEAVANTIKFAGIGDRSNGIYFEQNGTQLRACIYSDTLAGNDFVNQDDWNIDKLDGTGPSGITLDTTKTQILVIDFQALYVGRVRIGFDIGGLIVFCHEFNHANITPYPYIQNASLPINVGMTCSATVSTTMNFICCSAISEGGEIEETGFLFAQEGTGTAGNGTRAHILSIRPRQTFNSLPNRSKLILDSVDILVTGTNSIKWELVLGQTITGTTAFTSVNNSYSTCEYNTLGTISGNPSLVIASGYASASNQTKGTISKDVKIRYPISLNAAGSPHSMGTLSLLGTGIGGTSDMRAILNWLEIR